MDTIPTTPLLPEYRLGHTGCYEPHLQVLLFLDQLYFWRYLRVFYLSFLHHITTLAYGVKHVATLGNPASLQDSKSLL